MENDITLQTSSQVIAEGCEVSQWAEPLLGETVWLKQNQYEDAEAFFQKTLVKHPACKEEGNRERTANKSEVVEPLLRETVWLRQREYEDAEARAHQASVGLNPWKKEKELKPKTPEKKKGPTPLNYENEIKKLITDLQVKNIAVGKHVKDLQKIRQSRMEYMHQSLLTLSNAVQICVKRLGLQVGQYDKLIASMENFMGSMQSTAKSVEEKSNQLKAAKKKKEKGYPGCCTHKSLYKSFSDIANTWMAWCDGACSLKMGKLDKVSKIIENVTRLDFIENIDKMDAHKMKYLKMQANLKLFEKSLVGNKRLPVKNKGGTEKEFPTKMKSFVENQKNSMEKKGSEVSEKSGARNKGEKNIGNLLGNKETKAESRNWYQSFQMEIDEISLDGSLGSECFTDTSSSQDGDKHNNGQKGTYKKPANGLTSKKAKVQSSNSKSKIKEFPKISCQKARSTPPSQGKSPLDQKFEAAQGKSSFANIKSPSCPVISLHAQGKSPVRSKRTLSQQVFQKASPSEPKVSGKEFCQSPDIANKKQGVKVTYPKRSPKPDCGVVDTEKILDSCKECSTIGDISGYNYDYYGVSHHTGKKFENTDKTKEYQQDQLTVMAKKIELMCLADGATKRLQELSAETELLLKMVNSAIIPSGFSLRFSLLVSAFKHHEEKHSSINFAGGDHWSHGFEATGETRNSGPKKQGGKAKQPESSSAKTVKKANAEVKPPVEMEAFHPQGLYDICKTAALNPHTPLDRHRAGISSLVILDSINCLVLVDIINSCLKLYDISAVPVGGEGLFLSSLEIEHPYYMTTMGNNQLLVSCGQQVLALVQVSAGKKRLDLVDCIQCQFQYYGVGWIRGKLVACAVYEQNRINLVSLKKGCTEPLTMLSTECFGPELLAVVPNNKNIAFLERVPGDCMHLSCITSRGEPVFRVSLGGKESDVWNLACIGDKIVCCCKQTNSVLLFSKTGKNVTSLPMPRDTVTMPFAIGFSRSGHLYLANDAAWEEDNNHYITTEINCFSISK